MFDQPTVLRLMTTLGASAVLVPCRATTGFPISNSATPPWLSDGSVWLAMTSTESPPTSTVCGSMSVVAVRLLPRKPTMPGTPVQLSSAVIRLGVRPILGERRASAAVEFAATGRTPDDRRCRKMAMRAMADRRRRW